MSTLPTSAVTAVTAPTRLVDVNGRRLAYRRMGQGRPLVLCNRFRGILDTWDPAFLDALSRHFTVITFDYSGLGRSTGTPSYDPLAMAHDARDLIEALELGRVVIAGWSIGGVGAQVLMTEYPELVTHAIVIGSGPTGEVARSAEPLFFETAPVFDYSLEQETILFFEPRSGSSRQAAARSRERLAQRKDDLSVPIPPEVYMPLLASRPLAVDRLDTRGKLSRSTVPLMVIAADHDISFPVENWYDRVRELPKMQLLVFSQAGHGPQHEFPVATAEYIATFVGSTG